MRTLIARALALLLLVSCVPAAAAQETEAVDAERQQLVIDIIEASSQMDTLAQMRKVVTDQVMQNLKNADVAYSDEQVRIIAEIVTEMFAELEDDIMAVSMGFMYENFTVAELRDLLAFYRSPTGQKTIALMPQLMTESMQMMQGMMQGFDADFRTRLQKRLPETLADDGT